MNRLVASGAALGLAAVVVGVPSFGSAQSAVSWPSFHGNNQRNGVAAVNGPTDSTYLEWRLPTQLSSASPVVDANGIAYIGGDNGTVYAMDPAHPGEFAWQYTLPGGAAVSSTPVLSSDGKSLYVTGSNGNIVKLNTANGQTQWSSPSNVGGPITASAALTPDNATLLIATVAGTVVKVNTSNGSTSNCFNKGPVQGSVALSSDGATGYVATTNAILYSFSVANCTSNLNQFYLDQTPASSPAVDNFGTVYIGTVQGQLDQIQSGTSAAKTLFTVGSHAAIRSTPAIYNSIVYFGADDKNIYAISTSSGNSVWNNAAVTGGPVNSSPVIASGNNMMYIGSSDGAVYAFSGLGGTNATQAWVRSLGTQITGSPALSGDSSLWVATQGGTVDRFHAASLPPTPGIPPTRTPGPSPTTGPTNTPGPTSTPLPTGTPVTTPGITPKITLKKKTITPGQRQSITVKAAPNTTIHFRIEYPNGDHQSHGAKTNASGSVTYSYVQGASKIMHNKFNATVIAKAGSGANAPQATAKYKINFYKVDVSLEPRSQSVGKIVNIYVHAKVGAQVSATLHFPNGKSGTYRGKTGPHGFAHWRYKIAKGLKKGKKNKVTVVGQTLNQRPNSASKSFFTIK